MLLECACYLYNEIIFFFFFDMSTQEKRTENEIRTNDHRFIRHDPQSIELSFEGHNETT